MNNNGARQVLASSGARTFTFTGLPVGSTMVYVCIVDQDGAQLCQSSSVTVDPAPANFKVTDALTSFSVSQLAGTGDVSVLAAGAQTFASLSTYATTAASSDDVNTQLTQAFNVKGNAFIKSLAGNVNSYLNDPAAMQQVCCMSV